jgi:CBS domain-containing protein
MAGELIYAFRVMRLPLLDAAGAEIGKIEDLVVVPGRTGHPPRITGFVASSQRRRIFVNAARIAELDADGVRLRSWDIDLNPFKPRSGETLIGKEIIDRQIESGERVSDIGLVEKTDGRTTRWEVAKVRLASRNTLRRRPSYRLVDWREVARLFAANTAMEAEAARLRDMHPSDVAHIVRTMPAAQRRQLAESMDDERLADVLEELPETEQLRLIEGLDLDRLVGVLDEMEYDDLADLLGEMPSHQRDAILEAMDDDEAEVITRLLSYEESTAGGMMTPEIVILGPSSTVAEALAQIRDPDWTPSIASQVFVTRAPFKPPTGKHLGVVFMQRLLREPPSMELRHCLARDVPTVSPETTDRAVFEEFASYDMLALAVVDEAGRLLGAVSVDDVVDRMLGAGWRLRHRRQDRSVEQVVGGS